MKNAILLSILHQFIGKQIECSRNSNNILKAHELIHVCHIQLYSISTKMEGTLIESIIVAARFSAL